jgi:hypothetical protein
MKQFFLYLLTLLTAMHLHAQVPTLYLVDANKVAQLKKQNASETKQQIQQLAKQCDKLVAQKFGTVMDKKFTPPCGNMHEYMSMARYYWPDPTKPDGKPYIRKDGQKNPANDLITDDKYFDDFVDAVHHLSWGYFFTNDERYATKAISLIRTWMMDTATKMLPNLNHAQIRTGIDTGVATGIIDTHNLPKVVDGIALFRSSKQWTPADENGTQQWFGEYLTWLIKSANGIKEGKAKNNHGTFYEMQIVTIASFCHQQALAQNTLKNSLERLAWQIEPDGKQPLELERTAALSYSTFNLTAWCMLANAAKAYGVDIWHHQTKDGRSLKQAINYLMPYVVEDKKWEYQQINPYKKQDFHHLLRMAAEQITDAGYAQQAASIQFTNKNALTYLLYP